MPSARLPVITIIGPTASGKTNVSLALAAMLDAEIVNADAMQVYRGMDIGTAKVPVAQRAGIAHHLLDIWDVRTTANVAQFQQLARAAVADIHDRGKVPIVIGGSGLYVRAIIDNLQFPGTDETVRADLQRDLDALGAVAMHERLREVDPKAAAAILPSNGRRIIRALEVMQLTGVEFNATLPAASPVFASLTIGLAIERSLLDERIGQRVHDMWREGFVAEVEHLRGQGIEEGLTARKALGYAHILDALAQGRHPDTALEPTITATRRFARRQWSWFERDSAATWLAWDHPNLVTAMSDLWNQHLNSETT